MIISSLKKKGLKQILKNYVIEGKIDSLALGCMDDETVSRVTIDAIDGQCFCNISTEQKKRVFGFIHTISV